LKHAFSIPQNIRVPKSQNAIPFGLEPTVSTPITFAFTVLATINLNHEPTFVRDKINNKGTYRGLTPKSCSAKAMRSKPIPKPLFSFCHVAA